MGRSVPYLKSLLLVQRHPPSTVMQHTWRSTGPLCGWSLTPLSRGMAQGVSRSRVVMKDEAGFLTRLQNGMASLGYGEGRSTRPT